MAERAASGLEARTEVALISVNVAEPALLGLYRGKPVRSGIGKRAVEVATLALGPLNLAGDRQADLTVHGGVDKAVYAYPSEHLPVWSAELGRQLGPGAFGENLTIAGWLEEEVRIGDVWAWGEALLQVAQPRAPCFKLGMATGRPDVPKRLVAAGRTGWYLRVLMPSEVPVAGPIRVVARHPAAVTVRDAHRASLPGSAPASDVARLLALDPLAEAWKRALRRRLDQPADHLG